MAIGACGSHNVHGPGSFYVFSQLVVFPCAITLAALGAALSSRECTVDTRKSSSLAEVDRGKSEAVRFSRPAIEAIGRVENGS